MTRGSTLTIVYPMWNEESSIHLAIAAAREAAGALVVQGELADYAILIVDDASTDATARIADELAAADPRIEVVHHDTNQGLGGSIRTGLANAGGDLVLYTDADLPCDLLETLPKALRLLRVYSADLVSAYRHDRTGEGARRAMYSYVYNSLIRVAFGLRVRDVNFAFKLVRRPILDHVSLLSGGSFIDAELLIRASRLGFHTIQFGVDYFPRTRGVSTLSSGATIARILQEMRELRPTLLAIQALPAEELHPPDQPSPTPLGLRRRRRAADSTRRRLLIVNADDYGLTKAVSRGILRAHADGIVTSTSVLALGPAATEAGGWLAGTERIGVGVHLAAVGEDPPILSGSEIPTLVDRGGRLANSWRSFLPRALAGRIDPADLRREFSAQIQSVLDLGITIDHLDTHQHLHLWPMVRDVVLALARDFGISAVRVPRSATAIPGVGINYLASDLARRARASGLAFPGAAVGLDEAGKMDDAGLRRAIRQLAGASEHAVVLSTHPGEADDPDRYRYRWNYRWAEELQALTSPGARQAVDAAGFDLATYADLSRS
jgi:predicted glycoside hydrolase/deacetylase ChbG (UPF0249 family)